MEYKLCKLTYKSGKITYKIEERINPSGGCGTIIKKFIKRKGVYKVGDFRPDFETEDLISAKEELTYIQDIQAKLENETIYKLEYIE